MTFGKIALGLIFAFLFGLIFVTLVQIFSFGLDKRIGEKNVRIAGFSLGAIIGFYVGYAGVGMGNNSTTIAETTTTTTTTTTS